MLRTILSGIVFLIFLSPTFSQEWQVLDTLDIPNLGAGKTSSFGRDIQFQDSFMFLPDRGYSEPDGNYSHSHGAIFVYKYNSIQDKWIFHQLLKAKLFHFFSGFGSQICFTGEHLYVSNNHYSSVSSIYSWAHITHFRLLNGKWSFVDEIQIINKSPEYESITPKIACTDSLLFIGLPNRLNAANEEEGIVLIARLDENEKLFISDSIEAPSHQAGSLFGQTLAIEQNSLYVGSPQFDYNIDSTQVVNNVGRVYKYDINGSPSWKESPSIIKGPLTSEARFGRVLQTNDDDLMVVSDDSDIHYFHKIADTFQLHTFSAVKPISNESKITFNESYFMISRPSYKPIPNPEHEYLYSLIYHIDKDFKLHSYNLQAYDHTWQGNEKAVNFGNAFHREKLYLGQFYKAEYKTGVVILGKVPCKNIDSSWTQFSCEPIQLPNGRILKESGIYRDTVKFHENCTDLFEIDFKRGYGKQVTSYVNICNSYTVPSGKRTIYTSTSLFDTIKTVEGCDSVIRIVATLITSNVNIQWDSGVLSTIISHPSYQWVNCSENYKSIEGATQRYFLPKTEGLYGVEIQESGCINRSTCIPVTYEMLKNESPLFDTGTVRLRPNPSYGYFTYYLSGSEENVTVRVYDAYGRIHWEGSNTNDLYVRPEKRFANGPYIIVVLSKSRIIGSYRWVVY